jgi:hypothetical protein
MAPRTTLALLALLLAAPASAEGFRNVDAYGPAYAGEDGFAGNFVRGTYIGAPLTRVPRPSQIVPAPWTYGTYGIPTVTGIAAPPAAQPTLTVINAGDPNAPHRGRATAAGRPSGPQIITVQVPRR